MFKKLPKVDDAITLLPLPLRKKKPEKTLALEPFPKV